MMKRYFIIGLLYFSPPLDKYTATWTINKARELTNELWGMSICTVVAPSN